MHQAIEVVRMEARRHGATVVETEIVGMVPLFALIDALKYYFQVEKLEESMILDLYYLAGAEEPTKKTFTEMSLIEFGDEVRRASATPGGGSVAAVMGSYGAGLVCMVSGLSLSGRKFAAVHDEMIELRHAAETERGVLMDLVEKDSAAFEDVLTAFRLPETTDADKRTKADKLEAATKHASEIPLQTMQHSFKALERAKVVAEKGNANAITDAGVAAISLSGAMEGAALNVRINLGNIHDKAFTKKMTDAVDRLTTEGRELKDEILAIVATRMKELSSQQAPAA
jgi:glutamate formiminotransferase/formiminotetrahydrofolate cyclodeaminase